MIISRYLAKEVLMTCLGVVTVLLLIFMSNQLVRFLGMAAAGRLAGSVVLKLLVLQMPLLLGLLLPAAFYLAILLAYGRLYVDNEMTVLFACGISREHLLTLTYRISTVVIVLVAIFMLWLNPKIMAYREHIMAQHGPATLMQTLLPGRFQSINHDNTVYYVEHMTRDHKEADKVFMASHVKKGNEQHWDIITGERAHQMRDPKTGEQYILIDNGYRYFGRPGHADYRVIHFKQFGVQLPEGNVPINDDPDSQPTTTLLALALGSTPARFGAMAELQWRISMPFSVLLLVLLAVPLSRVNPRQGKYAQLLPAIIIYIIYANLMFVARDWLEEAKTPFFLGLWWVHALLLAVGYGVWRAQSWKVRRKVEVITT